MKPSVPYFPTNAKEGVMLRDHFATLVLHAVVTHGVWKFNSIDQVAQECYEIADAMMKAREPKQ
ncbi:MAG: hypothetical protein ING36_11535 [Burkholderiales bacterium]|jgi:hypothetical protein|nr:hypothetical protein [Microcystis sp. M020S1]MCA3159319.1 hypothetical protein [Burkholderiales bacterium]MCA3176148.1 hypothetical protein [Burkholderiales bacterium]